MPVSELASPPHPPSLVRSLDPSLTEQQHDQQRMSPSPFKQPQYRPRLLPLPVVLPRVGEDVEVDRIEREQAKRETGKHTAEADERHLAVVEVERMGSGGRKAGVSKWEGMARWETEREDVGGKQVSFDLRAHIPASPPPPIPSGRLVERNSPQRL